MWDTDEFLVPVGRGYMSRLLLPESQRGSNDREDTGGDLGVSCRLDEPEDLTVSPGLDAASWFSRRNAV